ncbi:DUF2867 domain-containing protein [Mesorhizobium sp. NPDC059054]|uniref:DUF2867 domain-containing protein n=1 Tax=Mesorhizobium sp. NPDC059054 TaxID=3346711 RepID=UPI0036D1555D
MHDLSKPRDILPAAQFFDCYSIEVDGQHLDARCAAERVMLRRPAWIGWLMALRNLMVRPFGLKTGPADMPAGQKRIGLFPLIDESPSVVVLGLDDRHLDFRLLVEVNELGSGRQSVSASTFVATHNLLGRAYLAIVMPFHRVIVPAMLSRVRAVS